MRVRGINSGLDNSGHRNLHRHDEGSAGNRHTGAGDGDTLWNPDSGTSPDTQTSHILARPRGPDSRTHRYTQRTQEGSSRHRGIGSVSQDRWFDFPRRCRDGLYGLPST